MIGGSGTICGRLNKRKELSFVLTDVISDFKNCEGILFYPLEPLSRIEAVFEEAIVFFEQDVESLGGIEGVVMYIWVDARDQTLKEEIVKRLRLKERGCVWEFGAGSNDIIPKMDQFFKEKVQTIVLKPAKRDEK